MSLEDDLERWSSDIDRVLAGSMQRQEFLLMGETPAVLQALGAPALPLMMTQDAAKKVMLLKHGIAVDVVKELPKLLEKPVAVFDSDTEPGSFVVLTEARHAGKPVISAIHLDVPRHGKGKDIQVNRIASVYGKDHERSWLIAQVWRNTRYYDKKKLLTLVRRAGLQLPRGPSNVRSNIKIISDEHLVNALSLHSLKDQQPEPQSPLLAAPICQSARNYLEADAAYQDSFRAPREKVAERMATTQKNKEEARQLFIHEAERFINLNGVEAFQVEMNGIAGPKATALANVVLGDRSRSLDKGHGLELSLKPKTEE